MSKKKLQSLILIVLLILGALLSLLPDAEPEQDMSTQPVLTEPGATVSGDGLTIHFIDVGQADCALLECGGEYMMIDGGNKEDGELVVSYLQEQGVEELSAVVCSHAHEDHVGGLPSVLAVYPTKAVYAPTRTYSTRIFDDFLYYTDQQGLEVTIPQPGDTISLGEATLQVLGPTQSYAEPNDTSIILRVDYGETSFLFTGDMEVTAENDMLDYWGTEDGLFQVDVLKVGHHGSETSTGYRFLHEVDPTYGVICVGEDNDYGHPHEEPMSRLNQAGVVLLRTDELGTVLAYTDGTDVSFTWEDQSASPANAEPAQPVVFIGSKKSTTFHAPDCGSLPAEKNQVTYSSYEEAIAAGCKPCQGCLG